MGSGETPADQSNARRGDDTSAPLSSQLRVKSEQSPTSALPRLNEDSAGLRWSFGQRSTSSGSQVASASAIMSSGSQDGSTSSAKQQVSDSTMPSPRVAHRIKIRQPSSSNSLPPKPVIPRHPSPSKSSATSDEEGMIKEEDAEEGEVDEARVASFGGGSSYRPDRKSIVRSTSNAAPSSSSSSSQPPSINSIHPSRSLPALSDRFSTATSGPPLPLPPSRRWQNSIHSSERPSISSTSRDLSRSDSYQPVRKRSPDRERERDGRNHMTPLRFPMTRSYDDATTAGTGLAPPSSISSPSNASLSASPMALAPLDGRLAPARGGDSYRPGSNSLPSRPPVAHRTASNGSIGEDFRSSSRRGEWERDRNRDRDRERVSHRRSASPDFSSRDELDWPKRDRWRSNADINPPSPTTSHHSLPSVPRAVPPEESELRRGSTARADGTSWVAGANAQQIKYNRWSSGTATPMDGKRERFGRDERNGTAAGPSLSSRLSEQPAAFSPSPFHANEESQSAQTTPRRRRGLSQQLSLAGSSETAEPTSPSSPSASSSFSPRKTVQQAQRPTFTPPQSDVGWSSRPQLTADGKGDSNPPDNEEANNGDRDFGTELESASPSANVKPLLDRISSGSGPPLQNAAGGLPAPRASSMPLDGENANNMVSPAIQPDIKEEGEQEEQSVTGDNLGDSGELSKVDADAEQPSTNSFNVPEPAATSEGEPIRDNIGSDISLERPIPAEDTAAVAEYGAAEAASIIVSEESKATFVDPTPQQDDNVVNTAAAAAVPAEQADEPVENHAHPEEGAVPSALDVSEQPTSLKPSPEYSVASPKPAELLAQEPVPGAGDDGTGLPAPIASLVAKQATPIREQADDSEALAIVLPEEKMSSQPTGDVPGQTGGAASDSGSRSAAMSPARDPPAPPLTDAVKDAVAVAEAVAADEDMAEADDDSETGQVTTAKDLAATADADPLATVDEMEREETQDLTDVPARKSRAEMEEAKQAAIQRLLTKHVQEVHHPLLSIDGIIEANARISQQTTMSVLESAIWGQPFPAPAEPADLYKVERNLGAEQTLLKLQKEKNKRITAKTERLRQQYKALNGDWKAHCDRLDKVAEMRENAVKSVTQPNTPNAAPPTLAEESQPPVPLTPMVPTMGGRANRRAAAGGSGPQAGFGFGDAVRSEAEFLEILASLESADMQDPEARAARTATTVPDQEINPDADELMTTPFDDRNHFVADPTGFYLDGFDPDYWSPEEKITFARKYALWPKQFGRIATALPNKTAMQCVHYYYLTKHQPGHDYKAITAARNRNQKRKGKLKPKKAKGSALMADLKSARGEELMEEDDSAASPRSRMMSGADSTALGTLPEEGESPTIAPSNAPTSRKRKGPEDGGTSVDAALGTADRRAKGSGRGGRRVKGQGKKAAAAAAAAAAGNANGSVPEAGQLSAAESPVGTPIEYESTDGDVAAAQALGALSTMSEVGSVQPSQVVDQATYGISAPPLPSALGGKGKRRRVSGPGPEGGDEGGGSRKPRSTTSSYWSIQERAEFLRALAVHGKEWATVSSTLGAKSAAQARNYFARNAEVAEFVEAAQFAEQNADKPLAARQELAFQWSKERLGLSEEASRGPASVPSQGGLEPTTRDASFERQSSPVRDRGASPELPRRSGGMGIMNLLNDESAAVKKKPSLQEWFGGSTHGDEPQRQGTQLGHFGGPSKERPYLQIESDYTSSTDSEGEATRDRLSSRPVPPPRYAPTETAQPRPYLPEARGITAAAASRPPMPSSGSSGYGERHAPSISIMTSPHAAAPRTIYSHKNERREDYGRYSHSPNYEASRPQLSPIMSLSAPRSASGSGSTSTEDDGDRLDRGGGYSQTRRSPLYERSLLSSQSSDRASPASSMAPPPPVSSHRSPSWATTSSVRDRGSVQDDAAGAPVRHPLHQSQSSHLPYSRPTSGISSNHLSIPSPSSRSVGSSPYPSPGGQTASPGTSNGVGASGYLSARSYGGEGGAHRASSASPYQYTFARNEADAGRRPGTSGGLSERGLSARASPLPPPPLPARSSSREEMSSSRFSAAAAPPPAPPKLPPPSSLVRPAGGIPNQAVDQFHREQSDHSSRKAPPSQPPTPGSSKSSQYTNGQDGNQRWQ